MSEFNFQLDFRLHQEEDPSGYLESLAINGCEDALVGVGEIGYVSLEFTRQANKARLALSGAIKNVRKAIPHAKLIRAEPYLINLSELALLFNCTKQNMSKYARGESSVNHPPFPDPIVTGKTSYWYIIEAVNWLDKYSKLEVTQSQLDLYYSVFSLNKALDQQLDIDPKLTASFSELIAA